MIIHLNKQKIKELLYALGSGLHINLDQLSRLVYKIVAEMCPIRQYSKSALYRYIADTAASMSDRHHDYLVVATRSLIAVHEYETEPQFGKMLTALSYPVPKISINEYLISACNKKLFAATIDHSRDDKDGYFHLRLIEKHCLLKNSNGTILERPQHMLMRISVGIHDDEDIDAILKTYDYMSKGYFIHDHAITAAASSPTAPLSSSYIIPNHADSINGISKTMGKLEMLAKENVGIGLDMHRIPCLDATIGGIGRVREAFAVALKESSKNVTMYLEPWHGHIEQYLLISSKINSALWIPDLFMHRVESDAHWSLMDPLVCPGLDVCWGVDFVKLYTRYEAEGRYLKQVQAKYLWLLIIRRQMRTGMPSIMYKDTCNMKSNQQRLGIIRCGSVSADRICLTNGEQPLACHTASIALYKMVDGKMFNFTLLLEVTKIITRNLNKIIDNDLNPTRDNHRSIAISVHGLADTFILMGYPYDSKKARILNRQIFETIYFGALEESCELAEHFGAHASFAETMLSRGFLQFDMWNGVQTPMHNWLQLIEKIAKYKVRNALLVSASSNPITAQILDANDSIAPYESFLNLVCTGNVSTVTVNKYLVADLTALGLYTNSIRDKILAGNGSIQSITEIPHHIRNIYKTAYELCPKVQMDMAAERGAFIDQSQSFNLYFNNPLNLNWAHFYGWRLGLKTGSRYLKIKYCVQAPNR